MIQRLFTLSSAVSLLLLALISAIAIRAHFTTDCFVRASGGRCFWINTTGYGFLFISRFDGWPVTESRWFHGKDGTDELIRIYDSHNHPHWLYVGPDGRSQSVERHLSAPVTRRTHYSLRFSNWICLTLPLPLAWAIQRVVLSLRRRRRIAEGHCGKCGYDLRASTNRCPECGAQFSMTPSQTA